MQLPRFSDSTKTWADNLVDALDRALNKPMQLPYMVGGEKPISDGLMMWDPATSTMKVSSGGVWKVVTLT